jgi:hypothetical protein
MLAPGQPAWIDSGSLTSSGGRLRRGERASHSWEQEEPPPQSAGGIP